MYLGKYRLLYVNCYMECCTAEREAYICNFRLYVSTQINETSDAKALGQLMDPWMALKTIDTI